MIEALRALLRIGNRYLEVRAPWRGPDDAAAIALRTSCEHLRLVAAAVAPVIPETSGRIAGFLGVDARWGPLASLLPGESLAGRPVTPTTPLFARVPSPTTPAAAG